jgi:hypothetical protein
MADAILTPAEVAALLPATIAALRAELTALPDRLCAGIRRRASGA